jgi:preprotein translocase subunit SecG
METIILSIHLILALVLIIVVLLQRSEGGGLGIGGGGGIVSSRGAATALSKLTWGLGIAFVATSLTLTVLAARDTAGESVIDRIDPRVPPAAETEDAPPDLGEDLLPPLPSDGPAVPPPVE